MDQSLENNSQDLQGSPDSQGQGGDTGVADNARNKKPAGDDNKVAALGNQTAPQDEGTSEGTDVPEGQSAESVEDQAGQMVMEIATSLAQLLMSNPDLADKIAAVIEEEVSGMSNADMGSVGDVGGALPQAGQVAPAAAPGADTAPTVSTVPPDILARIDALERSAADARLNKELSEITSRYNELRQHFGDILPESVDEKEVLQTYLDLLEGRMPMHKVAIELLSLRKALNGDGLLRDRLIAAAAQNMKQPPSLEGPGGNIAGSPSTGNEPPKTSAEALRRARQLWEALQGQPGS